MVQRIFETCQVEGCTRPHKARGYCQAHYQHYKRGVPIRAEIKERDTQPPEHCTAEEGCTNPVKARGLCFVHYQRRLRHGHTRYTDRKRPPKICATEGCDSHVYAKGHCHQHYQRRKLTAQKYGVSPERLAEMLKEQDGKCAICGEAEDREHHLSGRTQPLSVDHDHTTGAVRALLCNRCNRGIGMFQDDPEIIRRAIAYLDRHRPPTA